MQIRGYTYYVSSQSRLDKRSHNEVTPIVDVNFSTSLDMGKKLKHRSEIKMCLENKPYPTQLNPIYILNTLYQYTNFIESTRHYFPELHFLFHALNRMIIDLCFVRSTSKLLS